MLKLNAVDFNTLYQQLVVCKFNFAPSSTLPPSLSYEGPTPPPPPISPPPAKLGNDYG